MKRSAGSAATVLSILLGVGCTRSAVPSFDCPNPIEERERVRCDARSDDVWENADALFDDVGEGCEHFVGVAQFVSVSDLSRLRGLEIVEGILDINDAWERISLDGLQDLEQAGELYIGLPVEDREPLANLRTAEVLSIIFRGTVSARGLRSLECVDRFVLVDLTMERLDELLLDAPLGHVGLASFRNTDQAVIDSFVERVGPDMVYVFER